MTIKLIIGGFCGLLIMLCWVGMAWYAFHAEWAHLFGAFILQTGTGAVRDLVK